MNPLQKAVNTQTLSESSILLVGLLLTVVGFTFRDTTGITSLLAAVGIGLVIAGTVYIAVEASEIVRLSLVFISLVAMPLLAYGGIVQWIGGVMIGTVVGGALYSRVLN